MQNPQPAPDSPAVPGQPDAIPPAGYRLAHRFFLTETRTLVWMNIIGTVLFVLALAVMFTALMAYEQVGAPLVLDSAPDALPVSGYLVMLILTLVVHEALHGLAIVFSGNRPRFGAKFRKLVLFTTSDAFFTRAQYLLVALAPLAGISLIGLALMLVLPTGVAVWIGIMVALNVASSIGDIWMAAVTASFPAVGLFHDQEDGMSVYLPQD